MTDPIQTSPEIAEASAIPRRHEAHANPDEVAQTDDLPAAMRTPVENKSPAQWAYERLVLYIKKFEETLDGDHEVAMGFAGGDAGVMRIEGIGFFDPDMITFYGHDDHGARTQLVQHVTQLSVMLRALPRPETRAEPMRIGFQLAQELDEQDKA